MQIEGLQGVGEAERVGGRATAWVRLTQCECSGLCETERVWVWG